MSFRHEGECPQCCANLHNKRNVLRGLCNSTLARLSLKTYFPLFGCYESPSCLGFGKKQLHFETFLTYPQHYEYPNYLSRQGRMTKTQFEQSLWRDFYKKEACKKAGITLLIIPHTKDTKLEEFIKSICPAF